MKTLVIHDTEDEWGTEIIDYLREKGDDNFTFLDLAEEQLTPCVGCFRCWIKTPGLCRFKDNVDDILKEELKADRLVLLCPVTWGGYSPRLKILQDRSIPLVLPFFRTYKGETHHPPRYNRYAEPFLIGYGCDLTGAEKDIFRHTGENLSDNLFDSDTHTLILENRDSPAALDILFESCTQEASA